MGELTHASMQLEDIENTLPADFGNVVQGEDEGQITACSRNFDEIAKVVHNIPSIGDSVVITEGMYKYNLGLVKHHNEDDTIQVFFDKAIYSGPLQQQLIEGNRYLIDASPEGPTLTGEIKRVDDNLHVVFTNIYINFGLASLHLQSRIGDIPIKYDIVHFLTGINKDKQACVYNKKGNTYSVILLNGTQLDVQHNEIKLVNTNAFTSDQSSQQPILPSPGIQIPAGNRIPMPLFDPPTRDENPIPERESNILSCAFPTLFQTGEADINAPRLRSLDNQKDNALEGFTRHCLYWHDNRFAKHPRFLYCLFNRIYRYKLFKTKGYFLKAKKPTAEDFLPKNKKKTTNLMRAFTSNLPTTPGHKIERRNELENMCQQIQYMTANKGREERFSIDQEYEDYESSDDENQYSTQEQQTQTKTIHKRPIEGVIPCYWATLTTAPFRTSLIPYYINGHHDTDTNVQVRRHLAIENPNIVSFFSALRLELILKSLLVFILDLNDYYCVFEWGSGGVLHLHCILWNFKSHYLDDWDLKEQQQNQCFSKRKLRLIVDFFNVHVCEWNLGKEADGSWKNIQPEPDNAPHPASISKHDLDDLFGPLSSDNTDISHEEFLSNHEAKEKLQNFIFRLLEKVQQHNLHKPNPFGPPLPNQKCSKQYPKNQKISPGNSRYYCAKGYPKSLCEFNDEYILQEPFKTHLYKLFLGRNDSTINNYNPLISLALLANMDLQPVLTFDGLLTYCTKYITKNDNPDMFRDYRDDTGKPTDAGASFSRTEIPNQANNISKQLSKCLNDQIKYSMISAPELHHHLLNLPTHFASRYFTKIWLNTDLNKILPPQDITNVGDKETLLMQDDKISLYEKRNEYKIPNVNREKGITYDTIESLSFFLFHIYFFVRNSIICKKSRPAILLLKPYISPKKKNNERYCQYMSQTLMAYKPFKTREEILSLGDKDLENVFEQFFKSDICPDFVKERYLKANKTKQKKRRSFEKEKHTSQDEIYEAEIETSSDSESDDDSEPNLNQMQNEQPKEPPNDGQITDKNKSPQVPQIAQFTEAYQVAGYLPSKGPEYVGNDYSYFDDDKDVREEIRILSDEQDIIFDHSKDTWQPLYPDINHSAMKAKETLRSKIGIRNVSQTLDPNELDPTQTLFLDTILDWAAQCIECKKKIKTFSTT